MSAEQQARMWCDLLGWRYIDRGLSPAVSWEAVAAADRAGTPAVVTRTSSGKLMVSFLAGETARTYFTNEPTLATCALVRHAGPVDVGPCPECVGRLDVRLAAFDFWVDIIESREQITPMAMERWASGLRDLVHEHTGEWREVGIRQGREDPTRCDVTGLDDLMGPCACDGPDGKPTGRRVVPPTEAVLLAAARMCQNCAGRARRSGRYTCARHCESGIIPGPEGAREALRALTEGWREHLPVLADWMAAHGELIFEVSDLERYSKRASSPSLGGFLEHDDEPPSSACKDVPLSLAECPAVARWVLAWLAGDRELTVDERSQNMADAIDSDDPDDLGMHTHEPAIRRHLSAIEAHLTAAWERETVECGCWPSALTGERRRWPDRGQLRKSSRSTESVPCERCAGLGRVRPEGVPEAHAAAQ